MITELWVKHICETCGTRGKVGGQTNFHYDYPTVCPTCEGRAGERRLDPDRVLTLYHKNGWVLADFTVQAALDALGEQG